ncbi:MAG: hypothetical protein IT228_11920 [Flavobacteriales bacterium]|nr:hypothetical protein [Flavobacteriales bacterium]MCC6578041.1 hypothetical protein [Flavobacteriales bacterium]NUQ14611.1 hypothetical protein [Flavobacteriales bacterium]
MVIALSYTGVMAQPNNKALFDRAVDRLNCEAVAWSMESVKNSTFKDKCPCENATYDQVKECISGEDAAKTQALSEDIERVKKDFNDAWTKDEAVRYLTEGVFNDKTKHTPLSEFVDRSVKEGKEGKPRREDQRFKNITSQVVAVLDGWAQAPPPQQNLLRERAASPKPPANNQEKQNGTGIWTWLFVWLASVVASGALTVFLLGRLLRSHGKGGVSNEVKNYIKKEIKASSPQSSWDVPPKGGSSRDMDKLRDKVGKLEADLHDLRSHVPAHESRIAALESRREGGTPAPPPVPDEFLYLPAPDEQGAFGDASNTYHAQKHVYKLTKRGEQGSFVVYEQAIGLAIQTHDVYIDRVCDALNAYDRNAKRILTEVPGEARLEGGKWKMVRKARIRYEH